MKHSKKLVLLSLLAVLTLSFAFASVASAKMVKKADNFILFVDYSGSMNMTHPDTGRAKIDMALDTLKAMNNAIPELDYTSALFTFAPFEAISGPQAYKKSEISRAIGEIATDFEIFNRRTPMGAGTADIDPVVGGMSGKTALIYFTDGVSNIGTDPVAAVQSLRSKYGNNLCVHVVSFADKPAGKATIEKIRSLSPCTVVADYASLMAPGAMDQYAKDVFYEEVADAPAPAPAPAPVPMAKEVITFSLNFGFDKYEITDEMLPVLNQTKAILMEDPSAMYEISGHTDSTGPEGYNQGLSERRAASVKNWLIANGIDPSRLDAKGYGELAPKYDNGTKEGRKLNRRVEIQTK